MKKIKYEGVFLDNKEVIQAFNLVRGKCKLKKMPKDFHVTTLYKPAETHESLYGEKVTVFCTKYKKQSGLVSRNGNLTTNEGFKVKLETDNPELKKMIASIDKNWHITGGYDEDANCTNFINFDENSTEVSFVFEGIFTGCTYDNSVIGVDH